MANKKKFKFWYPSILRENISFLIDIGDICKNRKLTSCNAIAKKLLLMEKYEGVSLRTMNTYVKMAIEVPIERHASYLLNRTQRDTILVVRELPPMTEALREWALERLRRFAQYEKLFGNEKLSFKERKERRERLRQSGDWELFNDW
jgi:hypothetical protein